MFKLFLTLFFSFSLLFQTMLCAQESPDTQQEKATQETENEGANEVEKEEISEAQKEADAAEAAELREAGIEEEPPLD